MRALSDFTASEWLRLTPLAQLFKQLRNDALLSAYARKPAPGLQAFLAGAQALRGQKIALVIAFEQPWALDWQLSMARRNLPGFTVLALDNSRTEAARAQIRGVCERHGAPYLALPSYRTRHVNRSHGMAMSWAWHNVVRAIEPSIFGFLDHDLVPLRPVDPARHLAEQPVYGLLNAGRGAHWNLWAGYCFFTFARTRGLPLNFLYDFSRGLDTGGRNWDPLYQHIPRATLQFAAQDFVEMRLPGSSAARPVEWIDGAWAHIGGIGYNDNFQTKIGFFEALRVALDGGAALDDLLPARSAARAPA